jgi:hypothetical protein
VGPRDGLRQYGRVGNNKNLLPLPGVEPRLFGHPSHSPVTLSFWNRRGMKKAKRRRREFGVRM